MPRDPAHRGGFTRWKEPPNPSDPVRKQHAAGKERVMIGGLAARAAGAMIAGGGTTAASAAGKGGRRVRAEAGRVSKAGRLSRCPRAILRRCRRR